MYEIAPVLAALDANRWRVAAVRQGFKEIMEERLNDECKSTGAQPYEITVFLEDGTTPMTAAQVGLPKVLFVGDDNQQHSGREICAMRYDAARATPSFVGSTARLWTGSEVNGLALCNDKIGTGVNDAARLLREHLPSRCAVERRPPCSTRQSPKRRSSSRRCANRRSSLNARR